MSEPTGGGGGGGGGGAGGKLPPPPPPLWFSIIKIFSKVCFHFHYKIYEREHIDKQFHEGFIPTLNAWE